MAGYLFTQLNTLLLVRLRGLVVCTLAILVERLEDRICIVCKIDILNKTITVITVLSFNAMIALITSPLAANCRQ